MAKKEKKKDTTTVQVRRYVIDNAHSRVDQQQLPSLGWVVERLLNCWLSGSIEIV